MLRKLKVVWPLFKALWKLVDSPVWEASGKAVTAVAQDLHLKKVAEVEPRVSFCPRCGQCPDGDRRMDEAREQVVNSLNNLPKRHQLDAALAIHYLLKKL